MADLLKINESFFKEAADVIVTERTRSGEKNINSLQIEQVVRSYVQLGLEKKILDWLWSLDENTKNDIVARVVGQTQSAFRFTPAPARVWTNMDIIETQAAYGKINPMIARPRAAQESWEITQAYVRESSKGGAGDISIWKSIEDVFGGAGKSIQAALKGLGIELPIIWIIGICTLILFMTLRNAR